MEVLLFCATLCIHKRTYLLDPSDGHTSPCSTSLILFSLRKLLHDDKILIKEYFINLEILKRFHLCLLGLLRNTEPSQQLWNNNRANKEVQSMPEEEAVQYQARS